jgi:hypothetical protein
MRTDELLAYARMEREAYEYLCGAPGVERKQLPTRDDPIRAELCRLAAVFYSLAAQGADLDAIYPEMVAKARTAAESFNARQARVWPVTNNITPTTAGFYGLDEAENKMRRVYQNIASTLSFLPAPIVPGYVEVPHVT